MWKVVIGDLVDSIYKFNQLILLSNSFYSDDTILIIAILDSILNDKNYEKHLKIYGKRFNEYKPNFDFYFKTLFSLSFKNLILLVKKQLIIVCMRYLLLIILMKVY